MIAEKAMMMYSNDWDQDRKIMRDQIHMMRHTIKQADHDMRHAIKQALREGCATSEMFREIGGPRHYTIETVLEEIDSSISYLEDLPAEQVKPCMEKLEQSADRLIKLRDSLKR